MARPGLKYNRLTSGLGRPLPGKDHYSAMAFYIADLNLPSGFSTTNRVQKIFSLAQAEALGILPTHIDETKATGTITVSAAGNTGDTIAITSKEYGQGSAVGTSVLVALGTYTRLVTDTSTSLVATSIAATINAGTNTHGYTAVAAASVVTVTARPGMGAALNGGTNLATTIVGTLAVSTTQFTGGVGSDIDQVHYHISEAFRINPGIVLTIGLFTPPSGSHTFTELASLINYVPGDIRQLGVYTNVTMSTATIDTLNAQLQTFASQDKPCSAVLTMDISSLNLSAASDLSTLNDWRVTYDIAQDFGGTGYQLFKALGKTVGTMGATIGAISASKVSECIGWVGNMNMSNGTELEIIGFGNGVLFTDSSIQNGSLLDTLYNQQYSYLVKMNNATGTYFVDSNTCAPKSNTFCQIENVRTGDKIVRGIDANVVTLLNGPLVLNANGTLTEITLAEFERQVQIALDQMTAAGEISVNEVLIDPTQVVSSTSQVNVSVDYVAIGVGRNLVFNINQLKSL